MYLYNRLKNKNFLLLLSIDIINVIFCFYLSLLFRYDFIVPEILLQNLNYLFFLKLIFIKIFCFRLFALYRGMWRYTSVWDALNILKGNVIASIITFFMVIYFSGFQNFSRSVFIIDFILCSGVIGISRLGIRIFFSHIINIISVNQHNKKSKNILLIGAGFTGHTILRQILEIPKRPLNVVGFLDDDSKKRRSRLHDVEVLGRVRDLINIQIDYDEIYICTPTATKTQMLNIINECKKTKKPFKTLPSISELVEGKVSISQFREVSLVDLLGREEISLDKSSINKFIKGKRVIVTGAGGSIGSELVRQCMRFNPSVIIMIDNSELNLFEIEREVLSKKNTNILFKPILCDIRDFSIIDKVFKEFAPQIVFHAAAYKHVPIQESFPSEAVKTNIYGTINISSISVRYNVEKFVLVSTDKAVKPTNVMGATKRLAEILILYFNRLNENIDFMSVRFGNVLGSSGSVIPIFKEQIKNGGPLTITNPDMKRYFMSIPEASQLILQAGSIGIGGEIFILDMGKPIKIIDVANELIRLSGFEPNIDIPIKVTGIRPGEKIVEELSLPSENLDKTKHEKIFVLNDLQITLKSLNSIYDNIIDLKNGLSELSANQIRKELSLLLPEYKPENEKYDSNSIKSYSSAEA